MPPLTSSISPCSLVQELPKKKVIMTQERSKVLRETEENPFGDEEEEEAAAKASQQASAADASSAGASTSSPAPASSGRPSATVQSFSHTKSSSGSGSFFGSSKDKKKDKSKGKRKPFNLEAEKDQMKSVIADSSIAATNLMNSLQSINREKERISENQLAVERFETCKQLRRRVLRYVSFLPSRDYREAADHE